MAMRFDEKINLKLATDEAVVLLSFLSRELWNRNAERLAGSIEHPAEFHALHALLQELFPPLLWTGDPNAEDILPAARDSLLARHT